MPFPCDVWRAFGAAGLRLAAPADAPEICMMPVAEENNDGGRFSPPPTSGPACWNPWMMFKGDPMLEEVMFCG